MECIGFEEISGYCTFELTHNITKKQMMVKAYITENDSCYLAM